MRQVPPVLQARRAPQVVHPVVVVVPLAPVPPLVVERIVRPVARAVRVVPEARAVHPAVAKTVETAVMILPTTDRWKPTTTTSKIRASRGATAWRGGVTRSCAVSTASHSH